MSVLQSLRAFARYRTHACYRWAAVMGDGALLCEPCTIANYRQVFRNTRDGMTGRPDNRDWQCIGLTNSGEHEGPAESCAHCDRVLFESTEDGHDEA